MIQRIQTLWLALTALLSALLCSEYIIKFSANTGGEIFLGFSSIYRYSGKVTESLETVLPVAVMLVLISLLSLVSLLVFKKRNLQIRITLIIIVCSVLLVGSLIFYSIKIINTYDAQPVIGFRIIFPLLIPVFSLLAYRGIKKDEKLVRSFDRLR